MENITFYSDIRYHEMSSYLSLIIQAQEGQLMKTYLIYNQIIQKIVEFYSGKRCIITKC